MMMMMVKIIIIIIIILISTFMPDIHRHMLEETHVYRVYSAAAVLFIQSVLHVMLFRPLNMFVLFHLGHGADPLPPSSVPRS